MIGIGSVIDKGGSYHTASPSQEYAVHGYTQYLVIVFKNLALYDRNTIPKVIPQANYLLTVI
jgi:hypothetical protein